MDKLQSGLSGVVDDEEDPDLQKAQQKEIALAIASQSEFLLR